MEAKDYIDKNKQRFLEELFILLRQPSISTRDEGVKEFATLLAGNLKGLGIKTRIIQTPGHPVVFGELAGPPEAPTVLVYGHYDVQPPEPLDPWTSPPFEPTIRHGKIFARGASDNKGQFFTYLKAVEVLQKIYGGVPIHIKFLFEGEEEIGSPNLPAFAEAHRDLLAADLTLFSDSHIHESGRPLIILGLKGLLYVEMSCRGVCSDQHSGRASSLPNPAWDLVWALNTLKDRNNRILIPGFYDRARELIPAEREAIDLIPCDEATLLEYYGIEKFAPGRFSDNYYFNNITEPTCNISGISSGYTGAGNQNVLPARAIAKLDFRLVPDQDPDDIFKLLTRHLAAQGFDDVEAVKVLSTESSRTPIDHPALEGIRAVLQSVNGLEPIIFPSIGASGPNFVFTNILHQPCFLIPFAGVDQCNHGPDENLELQGFFNGIKTAVALFEALARSD